MNTLDPNTVLWFARALVHSQFKVVPTPTYEEQLAQAAQERQYLAARNTAVELLPVIAEKDKRQ